MLVDCVVAACILCDSSRQTHDSDWRAKQSCDCESAFVDWGKIRLVLDIGCSFATAPHAYSYSCARIKRFAKCFVIHIDKWMGAAQAVASTVLCIKQSKHKTRTQSHSRWELLLLRQIEPICMLATPIAVVAWLYVSSLPCAMKTIVNEWRKKKTLRYIAHIYDYHIVCPTMMSACALARTPLAHTWYSWRYSRYDSHAPHLNNILFMTFFFFIVIHFFCSARRPLLCNTHQRCYLCAADVLPLNVNISGATMQRPKIVQNLCSQSLWELDL